MLKDEQNCSYNGGGDARPLKIWSDFSSIQYVVGEHDVLVATSGADKKPTHVISVKLAYWIYPDMEFLRLDSRELTGDVRK